MHPNPFPEHVAIIMDGNGRWAKSRHFPRAEGHRRGVAALNAVTEGAVRAGIKMLTVFAFSSENWNRPAAEVAMLMKLFASALDRWSEPLKEAGVVMRVAGDRSRFSDELNRVIDRAEQETAGGTRMVLNIAANYGGRWDMAQAARKTVEAGEELTAENIERHLALPAVDLMIRTGGESRLSNFLLWQSAYAEIYFTGTLWPDFTAEDLNRAVLWYTGRERRFGRTSEQLQQTGN